MQVLNKYDKEQLVIKLHKAGKTIRDIAQAVHISFTDIGKIIRKINGQKDEMFDSRKILKLYICFQMVRRHLRSNLK